MRPIKFRGRDMNGHFVYGLLTKKRIRSSGEIRWAIATGNCSLAETVPVNENSIAQLVGLDCDGREVYDDDTLIDQKGREYTVSADVQVELFCGGVYEPLYSTLYKFRLKEGTP